MVGNWCAPNVHYQERIWGKELRKMLLQYGFQIDVVDELQTLSQLDSIHLQTFRQVRDPPRYHRQETLTVTGHRLYDNKIIQKMQWTKMFWVILVRYRHIYQTCRETMASQGDYWQRNRDMAAALNMLHILQSLHQICIVPWRFRRKWIAPAVGHKISRRGRIIVCLYLDAVKR